MKFNKELIITGVERKIKKDNSEYYIVHVLMENGQTCSLMYKGNVSDLQNIQSMQKHYLELEVSINKYGTRVDVLYAEYVA